MELMYDKFKIFRKYEIDKQIHVNGIEDIKNVLENISKEEREQFINNLVIGIPETGKTAPLIRFGKDITEEIKKKKGAYAYEE